MCMYQNRFRIIIFIFLASLLVSGCGDKKEKAAPQSKKIVSQKIASNPEETKPSQKTEKVPPSTQKTAPTQTPVPPETKAEKPKEMPAEFLAEKKPVEDLKKSSAEQKKLISPVFSDAQKRQDSLRVIYGYNPKGKVDPFRALFKDKVEQKTPVKKMGRTKKNLGPLELVELSQLKIVATLLAPSGNRAMVEDSTGKGYIVKVGTYVGLNSGRIIKITKDRLIVEERIESMLGKTQIQKRELKLQKPPGE